MLEQGAAEGIDVWIGIFYFTDSSQYRWDGFEAEISQIADIVVFDISLGERFQVHETRISVSQNSVSIAWDNSTFSKGFSDELFNNFFVWLLSFVEVFKLCEPFQAFLIG